MATVGFAIVEYLHLQVSERGNFGKQFDLVLGLRGRALAEKHVAWPGGSRGILHIALKGCHSFKVGSDHDVYSVHY